MTDITKVKICYEPPKVITYSAEDLIEKIGPAVACSFNGPGITC